MVLNPCVDLAVQVYILIANEVYHFAWLAHSTCPAYALKVLLGGLCKLKLNHVTHIHRVQTSRNVVVAYKHWYFAFLKQAQCLIAHLQRDLFRVIVEGQTDDVCIS